MTGADDAAPRGPRVSNVTLQDLERHLAVFSGPFLSQGRFHRLHFSLHPGPPPHFVIEGMVSRVEDFTAVGAEWEKTRPPAETSVFVHIDPPPGSAVRATPES